MTIGKTDLHIIDNKKGNQIHKTETMALLKKLLEEKGSSQLELANTLGRDKTTVNRWVKNSREISWENAEAIAKVLGCHPVEIYQPSVNVVLKHSCSWDGLLKDLPPDEQIKIKVPFEWYNDKVKAVQMDSPGTPIDGEIWLFDIPKNKKIDKNCVNQICYMTASASFKKTNHHKLETSEVIGKTKVWHPLVALIKPVGNGKLKIVNSYTNELLNPLCDNLIYDDFEIAAPVKAKYDPELIIKHSK
jgi:transcriptional regulator with XRE-family HTH domain